jgi:predicted PurR-regulated permease PerM
VSRGVIGISVLQALLAGIGLMVAGIPQASLITFGVLVFGIIQIGPSIILIPVIIWAWTIMETSTALLSRPTWCRSICSIISCGPSSWAVD